MRINVLPLVLVALIGFALVLPSEGWSQSHRKARAEGAVDAFNKVCLAPDLTRRDSERRAKPTGVRFSRPGPNPTGLGTVSAGLSFTIKSEGCLISMSTGPRRWA
ncbi:hypothetical protein [Actibacterium sp. 188UL27-1]|uniref:hypothetical protein n=1 Tax=Actibacterium sp. 188UL27-1 TaxID=2786961 RepID=UPI001959C360|nr:hypothetical protein [Actibacterium sp. 188UL27-1]MBM7067130.1 hypothetical protein [Actibacterium sp. 188UL27-1]